MPYIGTQPLTGQFKKLDAITVVNGQAAYTMQYNSSNYKPATANALLVSVNGVIQAAGDAYTINGSTITFTENLVTGDTIDFIIALGDTGSAVTPVDGSVTTAKLANDAVTSDKLAHDISVQTSLSVPTIKDSSGTNTGISIDSSGRVTTPARPSFRAIVTSNVESTGTIQYNVEDFDHGGNYDTSTYKFTAPVAGLYFFSAQAYSDGNVRCKMSIQKNGSDVASTQVNSAVNASSYEGMELSTILDLDANDEISVSSGSFNYHIAANASFFCGYLIG